MADALEGIRILDLSQGVAGPIGVLLMAEHGADVIKVERPGGDPFRTYEGYRCWNRSRRSVILDLDDHEDTAAFKRLTETADVLVESFRPGTLERRGLGLDQLLEINPALVVVSCPAYPPGHRLASRSGYDALVQASCGYMWEQPGWRPGPIFSPHPWPSLAACYLVAVGALAGLAARERTGRGQHVETSLLQGALLYSTQLWQEVERGGATYHDTMAKTYPPGIHQPTIFECADHEWLHLSVLSGLPPKKSVNDILGVEGGPGEAARQRSRILERKRDELIAELRANHHAVEAVAPPEAIFNHPQSLANGTVTTVVDPDVGPTRQMGVPIHLLATPGRVIGPQPRPGEHNDEVLASLPRRRPATGPERHEPVAGPPLAGVRVIDFGQYLAGPFGPMILSDLGADVIKVEPVTGDAMRNVSKPFVGCQRGKRSLALNLKDPAGLDAARRLIGTTDVVHHNMTRGVATKLGIDYPACRAVRPDIIYCNTYAYGLPDPLGASGGLDPLYQASAGIEYEAGAVDAGHPPLYVRFGMCDTSNAMLSVVGVMLALLHRRRTGAGQELWTSLHDGGMLFSSDVWLGSDGEPWPRAHLDAGQHGISPMYRLYRTQDDGWICIAAASPDHRDALCRATGVTDGPDVEPHLESAFSTRTALAWSRRLDAAGVPNEIPVDTVEGRTVLHDDDNVRLGLVADYEHPVLGRLRQYGSLINFSETRERIAGPPPLAGQHSREILREAGLRDGEIDALIAAGTVYEPDADYGTRFHN